VALRRIAHSIAAMRSWRHAGEQGAVVIYPYRGQNRLALCLVWAILLILIIDRQPTLRHPAVWVTSFAVPATYIFAQRRRALILTADEVIHRPAVAQPTRVPFDVILTIRPAAVDVLTLFLRPMMCPGVVLELANGETYSFPLGSRHPREALATLSKATGKEIIQPTIGKCARWGGSIWD
jgi:hypothetical protein